MTLAVGQSRIESDQGKSSASAGDRAGVKGRHLQGAQEHVEAERGRDAEDEREGEVRSLDRRRRAPGASAAAGRVAAGRRASPRGRRRSTSNAVSRRNGRRRHAPSRRSRSRRAPRSDRTRPGARSASTTANASQPPSRAGPLSPSQTTSQQRGRPVESESVTSTIRRPSPARRSLPAPRPAPGGPRPATAPRRAGGGERLGSPSADRLPSRLLQCSAAVAGPERRRDARALGVGEVVGRGGLLEDPRPDPSSVSARREVRLVAPSRYSSSGSSTSPAAAPAWIRRMQQSQSSALSEASRRIRRSRSGARAASPGRSGSSDRGSPPAVARPRTASFALNRPTTRPSTTKFGVGGEDVEVRPGNGQLGQALGSGSGA